MPGDFRFSGVLTPVIMPFDSALRVNAPKLIAQCRWLLTQHVDIAIFGTNSEANSLGVDEKIDLLDQVIDAGIDPIHLMPGTGLCAITETSKLTSHAVRAGCGGVLMLPPFYYKGVSDEGLFRAYSEVIARVGSGELRIYLYHIPPVSQVGISLSLIERLIKAYPGVVVGIKDSSGEWENTQAMLNASWDDFVIFAGSESFLLQTMRHGGAGCISATANINPAAIRRLFENWNHEDADAAQAELNAVRQCVQRFPVIPALKSTIAQFSGDSEWRRVRPPLVELSDEQHAELLQQLAAIGFSISDLLPKP